MSVRRLPERGKVIRLAALLLSGLTGALLLCARTGNAQPADEPKPLRTYEIRGRLLTFLESDYSDAGFCVGGDSLPILGWSDSVPMYFAIAHLGSGLTLRCETVAQVFPDGRSDTTDVLRSAWIGPYTSDLWWKGILRTMPEEYARSWFDAQADSLTENPRLPANCR
jgi:hypothetical protein